MIHQLLLQPQSFPFKTRARKNVPQARVSLGNESFSSCHEPLTPDSGCLSESPRSDVFPKKQRVNMGPTPNVPEMVLTHQILNSLSPNFLVKDFNTLSGSFVTDKYQFEAVSGHGL
ncbi:hypothetical protein GIB67_042562 [Kingdonia uniflora]|uniref:Uncharacterized protein n=1 Tax=Kingdonia uniflora TaxID=39325 RepID=A0A7J7M163_9MAGN|nr:hypothetical protein GIB67_042562 [Kingdonia uniflora]